ncbi:RNA-binding protein [Angomonas deanei]|uniref:RNA recognition motif. (A.k.a. RRM, RBD, or RNP domain), putative n=1 Tax=Angomonas deanei TaxID=59799 RepID=A0A7G2CMX7_9TRYP|nr:RNA-binding protein [Angomonas deanei]CAD2220759.1 RNA recognition motif. (a.k.a. RRM, RBD, or RNP domain), putative [Angomonas deanei]|eukprot:EPY18765.1 RNA-binding protein [Angomonas deanei]
MQPGYFVARLPAVFKWDDLKAFFDTYGEVERLALARHPDGTAKNYGWLYFRDPHLDFLRLGPFVFKGKTLAVRPIEIPGPRDREEQKQPGRPRRRSRSPEGERRPEPQRRMDPPPFVPAPPPPPPAAPAPAPAPAVDAAEWYICIPFPLCPPPLYSSDPRILLSRLDRGRLGALSIIGPAVVSFAKAPGTEGALPPGPPPR